MECLLLTYMCVAERCRNILNYIAFYNNINQLAKRCIKFALSRITFNRLVKAKSLCQLLPHTGWVRIERARARVSSTVHDALISKFRSGPVVYVTTRAYIQSALSLGMHTKHFA